jgi:hypothetical protein
MGVATGRYLCFSHHHYYPERGNHSVLHDKFLLYVGKLHISSSHLWLSVVNASYLELVVDGTRTFTVLMHFMMALT